MIPQNEQVTNLEQSTALREAGIEVDSFFVHDHNGTDEVFIYMHGRGDFIAPAYTLSELLEMLPDSVEHKGEVFGELALVKYNGKYHATYSTYSHNGSIHPYAFAYACSTREEACANLLLKGLAEGWLDKDEINGRCK